MTRAGKNLLTIHTDGGARGNPGPGAIGVLIERDGRIIEAFGRFIGDRVTNNEAEYTAVEVALTRARDLGATDILLFLDSELVVNQLKRNFKIKDKDLGKIFLRIWNLMQGFRGVTVKHVPRDENAGADALVNNALDAAGF